MPGVLYFRRTSTYPHLGCGRNCSHVEVGTSNWGWHAARVINMPHRIVARVFTGLLLTTLPMVLTSSTANAFGPGTASSSVTGIEISGSGSAQHVPSGSGSPPIEPPKVVEEFSPPPKKWDAGHRGVDLAASPKTQVRTIVDGEVRFAGNVAGKPVVSVDIGNGLATTFEPVNAEVSRGDHVEEGDAIGTVADEPRHCPESCLHVGLREIDDEKYFNPVRLWDQAPVAIVLLPVDRTSIGGQ